MPPSCLSARYVWWGRQAKSICPHKKQVQLMTPIHQLEWWLQLAFAQTMQCSLMAMVIYALDGARIVYVFFFSINKLSNSSGFAFTSVLVKQSFQEAADALSFNARAAVKFGKIWHMICDTFDMYRVVLLTCAMESRTASTAYHVLVSVDPTVTSWYFSSHSAIQVFHAWCSKDNSVDTIHDKTD